MTGFLNVVETAEANWTRMLRTSMNRNPNDQTRTEAERLISASLVILKDLYELNVSLLKNVRGGTDPC